ncbi:hypothetical protein GQ42DRAFT_161899 [Ramicandelaber brevisporus]|nr:hypothetical protein GQ42DRAFT_161899 [Ramicandelaber brevisporus]
MTADSTKSVSKRTSEPQAAVNSPGTPPSAQSSKVKRFVIESELSMKYIELLLGSESLSSTEIGRSVSYLCDAVRLGRHSGIPYSLLLESRVFEALIHAIVLIKELQLRVCTMKIGDIIRLFPLSELKLYYTKTVFPAERIYWLLEIVLPKAWHILEDCDSTVQSITKHLKEQIAHQ